MKFNYPYLKDKIFLKKVDLMKIRVQTVKVTVLNWNEEPIRALCVAISSFSKTSAVQLNLFNNNISKQKVTKHDEKLDKIVDELNSKYKGIITYASKIKKEGQYEQRNN